MVWKDSPLIVFSSARVVPTKINFIHINFGSWVNAQYGGSLYNIIVFHKSPHSNVIF
jgi:hypothetical protein